MHKSDPKKYMEVVNSLKSGTFDKKKASDTSSIQPNEWFSHFSNLLGKPQDPNEVDLEMENNVNANVDSFSELGHRI